MMIWILCGGGLVALVVGVILYVEGVQQRRRWANSTIRFMPHVTASGEFMCFALHKRPEGAPGDQSYSAVAANDRENPIRGTNRS